MLSNVITDRPIIRLAVDQSVLRPPLGVARDAGITQCNRVHLRWIENIQPRRMDHVLASGAVATFTADVLFRRLLGVDVVADGMASVTRCTGRALHVVGGVVCRPPVGPLVSGMVLAPLLIADDPLDRERIVIISLLREVTLLPDAPVHQRDLVHCKLRNVIRVQVRDDRVRVFARVPS